LTGDGADSLDDDLTGDEDAAGSDLTGELTELVLLVAKISTANGSEKFDENGI
jgi:hypothetical protein